MRRIVSGAMGPLAAVFAVLPALPANPALSSSPPPTSRSVSYAAPSGRASGRAVWPGPITAVQTSAGPRPGETTISWSSTGTRTSFFKVKTALTPFRLHGGAAGWHEHVFKVPGRARSLTLSPRQTARAGAALGRGRHLFVRVYAVHRRHHHSSQMRVRGYAHIRAATIAGRAPAPGTPIRVASFNVRLAQLDAGTAHAWSVRAPLIAADLAAQRPAVVAVQELVPAMWTSADGGPGLEGALRNQGIGSYRITRTNGYTRSTVGDARILYDSSRLAAVKTCRDRRHACGIEMPGSGGHPAVAQYAKFRDRVSGVRFWFVSVHLGHGNSVAGSRLRRRQARAIIHGLQRVDARRLPVILGADTNSYQTGPGHDAAQSALRAGGFYDTSAAVTQVNLAYSTHNWYRVPEQPSPNGFGARLDTVMTRGMPGADRFENVRTGAPYPSDHNMVIADLRLPVS